MSPRSPLDEIDDGNPYGGNGASSGDLQGATRVQHPGVSRPGAAPRIFPEQERARIGTTGRASLNVQHPTTPIDLASLPVNPLTHVGAIPTKFTYDPRTAPPGSLSQVLAPAYLVMDRLSKIGVEAWMFSWVHERARRGFGVDSTILRKLEALHYFGEPQAAKLYAYCQQVNEFVARAMGAAAQSARARIARSIGR